MREEYFSSVLKGLCVGKYTRVARGQDGVEVKSMTDLVKDMLHFVQDVRAVRKMG